MSRQRNFLDAISVKTKVPATCRYWQNGRCYNNSQQCTFLHGYICRNDGDCSFPDCKSIHLKQKGQSIPSHSRSRRFSRSCSRSPSPRYQRGKGGESPRRYHSRTPPRNRNRRYSRSPRRRISRSRSPRRRFSRSRSRSIKRRTSRSHSRFRSRSPPRFRSRSPKFRSKSPRFRGRSPTEYQERIHSRSHSKSRNYSNSPISSARTSEGRRSKTPVITESATPDIRSESTDRSQIVTLEDVDDGRSASPQPECISLEESGDEHRSNSDEEIEVLSCNTSETGKSSSLKSNPGLHPKRHGPSITELTDRIAYDFMKPETQALLQNILKLSTEERSSPKVNREDSPSPDPIITEKILEEMALDLEEVGEEVDDYFVKAEAESLREDNERKAAVNPSPPKVKNIMSYSNTQTDHPPDLDYHSDWDLKFALENPEKPLEKVENISFRPPVDKNRGNKLNSSSLWTPALDRRQVTEAKLKMSYQAGKSNWEVETPYVARNTKKAAFQKEVPLTAQTLESSRCVASAKPEPVTTHGPALAHLDLKRSKTASTSQQPSPMRPLLPSGPNCNIQGTPPTQMQEQIKSHVSGIQNYDIKGLIPQNPKNMEAFAKNIAALHSKLSGGFQGEMHDLKNISTKTNEADFRASAVKSGNIHKSSQLPSSSKKSKNYYKPVDSAPKKESTPELDGSHGAIGETSQDKEDVIESDGKSSLEEMENLIQNKTKLLKQIQLLESQRSVLQDQKNNIVRNHKGDSKSLDELLEENSFLHEEVGKQITKRSDMVHKLNVTLVRVMKNRKGHEAAKSQSKSPEHNQRRGRSPEPDQRYAKSAENRQRGSDSPERSHRYRTSPKHSREFSRSPEHSRRNQRSPPPYPQRHQRSPKNFTRHARSPRRSSGRSKSPESNQKRSLTPEPSRMKRPRSPVPVSVKVQEKHWSRSHIMGTLKKFKKDLLSEVDLPRPSNVKRLPQDNDPDVDDRIREGSQSQNIKRQTEKEYTTQNLKTLRSDENTINYSKFDSRESEKHNRQWQSESKKSLSSVVPEADTDRVGLKELQARMRLSSIMDPKTLFRFMDLGMHWCKLCDMVFETIPMYCSHLLAASHLSKLKNDTRPWLSKAPKEDKKPVAPDANILHIPILGSEFYHSLPVIYCSLCNVFLRDVGEAVKHPESDKHTGNFKTYKDSHPDKVESYRKAHNAALSRHKLSEQKKLIKSEIGDESSLQIEDKLLREIKSKRERIMKQKSEIERDKDKDLKARSHGSGSVRVASREQRPTVPKEDPSSVSASHEGSSGKGSNSPKESDSVPTDKEDNKPEMKKSEKDKVEDEEDVKEKNLEPKNEDPGGKFKQLSQDKPAKENSMGIRFPLFGKMPSFRKKASFTLQPKTSGNPIPKDSISSNCKNSNIKETSDIKLSDKKEVLQLDCNIPGKKEALQLGCKLPGKKGDLMLGCKLPGEEEGLQLDCKLPDKKESSQLEGKLPEKKETFQIKGRLPDKETFQIKGRLPDKETFQLECKMTEKKETFKLECNLPEKKDEKAIEIDNVSIKVDSQTNLKIDAKSIQEDKFDEQGGLCDNLGETSSMGEIISTSLVMVEGRFVKETKLQEEVNTVQCISTRKEGNQELSNNVTNTIERGEEVKMHIDESAPQTEKEKINDCVEIANVEAKPAEGEEEESTDDISSATMEALELLNIPLPGFNSAKKNILVSNVISSEPTGMVDVQEVMEIPLPPRDSPIKTVEMQDINPFCHGVQMDEQISAYGTKCQNLITVGSGYVDISFSSQESGIDSPCSEREHTPPPPGTETVERGSELSKETVHFVDKGRATPPPPGTEPLLEEQVMDMDEIYSVKVDSVQKPKEDTDDSDLKCEDVVEPNKCLDGDGRGGGEEFEMEANLLAQATLCSDGEMPPDISEIVQLSQEISGDLDAKRNETNVIGEMFLEQNSIKNIEKGGPTMLSPTLELDENLECLDDNLKFEELCTGVSESLEEVINVNEQIDFALIAGEEPRNGNVDMASSFESVECNKEAAESSLEVGDKDDEKEECDKGAAESSLKVDDRNKERKENIHYKKCVVILDDIVKKGDEKLYKRDCIHKEGDGEINDDAVAEKGENANMEIVEKGESTIEEEENDGVVKSIQEENSPIRKGEMITSDCGEKVSLSDTEAMESSKKSEEVVELSSTPRRTTRATKPVICEEKETNKIQAKPKSAKGKTLPSKQQKVGVSGTEEEETLDSEAAIRKPPVLSAKKVLEINQQVDCVEESAQQVTSVDIIEKEQICPAEPFSSRRSTRGLGALHVEVPKEGDSKASPKKEPLPCRRSSRTTRSSAVGGKEEKPQILNAVEIVPEEDDVGESEEVSSSQEKEEEEQCSSVSSSNVQESTKETLSEKTTARSSRSNQKTTAAEPLLSGRSSRRAAVAASKAMAAQLKDQHKPLSSPLTPECDS